MSRKTSVFSTIVLALSIFLNGCVVLQQGSKYNFNDGLYHTKKFSKERVYVLRTDEDTIAVFPVLEFDDSTAILTKQRVNYTSRQKRFKDGKSSHEFYRPSFDIDAMTIPVKYRPSVNDFPNQLTTNFNGAVYCGYRIDAYKLNYKRTPLNIYQQSVKHIGYSAGLYAGIGNTLVDGSALGNPNFYSQYEGVLFITGIGVNVAVQNLTFGVSLGADHLLDRYRNDWIYQGKPCIGFTLGLNIN